MVQNYIDKLKQELQTGNALEHSYRPALKNLIESLDNTITAVNEPSRSAHGAPDFVFLNKNNVSLIRGYAETKDIYIDLDQIEKTEQLKRYLGYSNLFLTNYLEFRFFRNGEKYQTIAIAKKVGSEIQIQEDNLSYLERELKAFLEGQPETITSAIRLAQIMGGKAARIKTNVISFLKADNEKNQELIRIYTIMQKLLVHDLTIEKFADMYAQTLVYGLFVARYYDETPENFSRQEARDLIPASNPFLQHFFDHIVGPNFDKRLQYIVDELCDVFSVSAVRETVSQHYNLFGEAVDKDPVIHFYEDFLKEYDPQLRKSMGAYYTPVPVVQFIIRAVDDVLKNEFGLSQGLADTTKIERTIMQQGTKAKQSIHKVQILDPAVGTATFLNETVKFLFQKFKGQEGVWESYVEKELLPRLHGFELMMAPYTIAHLKLALTFKETGIDHFDHRLGIYLTNTLEEGIKMQQTLFGPGFGQSIAEESMQAANIKNNIPVMVVIGNPPYSVSSSNKSEWITYLTKVYKEHLNERNIQPLSDDYIKFIRFAEHLIEKNGSGIVAMITNNSFLDGIIHRQMRKHLLVTFDEIYILDLHGNAKKKETAPDGAKDENVFAIQQGVSINIFVRKNVKKKGLGTVYHADVFGRRKEKFEILNGNSLNNIKWQKLDYSEPYYFFVPKDFRAKEEYDKGFKINELFIVNTSGVKTHDDKNLVSFNPFDEPTNKKYLYRPFDIRWINYDMAKVVRHRFSVMKHMLKENISLLTMKQLSTFDFQHVFVSTHLSDICSVSLQTKESTYVFPLYLYHEASGRTANLKTEIVKEIEGIVTNVTPEEIFDYIYAVLHSPSYREKYKEFLKIDFPRIPYPKGKESFKKFVELGGKLRQLHLMENSDLSNLSTTYPITGENIVEKAEYQGDRVHINDLQYFGNVPKEAWEFYIGGYQPAQKWLKDRKGKKLTYEDIIHYQKIITVLTKTIKTMQEIDQA